MDDLLDALPTELKASLDSLPNEVKASQKGSSHSIFHVYEPCIILILEIEYTILEKMLCVKPLEVKIEVKPRQFVDVIPQACSTSFTNCQFRKNATKLRVVYDISSVYLVSVPTLYCTQHSTSVSLLKHVLNAKAQFKQFVFLIGGTPVPLVFSERMIFTSQLYSHIIELYKQTFGFETVASLIASTWVNNLNSDVQIV